jgi:hypothetical protein
MKAKGKVVRGTYLLVLNPLFQSMHVLLLLMSKRVLELTCRLASLSVFRIYFMSSYCAAQEIVFEARFATPRMRRLFVYHSNTNIHISSELVF